MPHSKTTGAQEKKGLEDTFLFLFKPKGHKTFRVENCGRKLATVNVKYEEYKAILGEYKIIRVAGLTGECEEIKL